MTAYVDLVYAGYGGGDPGAEVPNPENNREPLQTSTPTRVLDLFDVGKMIVTVRQRRNTVSRPLNHAPSHPIPVLLLFAPPSNYAIPLCRIQHNQEALNLRIPDRDVRPILPMLGVHSRSCSALTIRLVLLGVKLCTLGTVQSPLGLQKPIHHRIRSPLKARPVPDILHIQNIILRFLTSRSSIVCKISSVSSSSSG